MEKLSLYIHYPFCASKCPYCDFNSYCNITIENDKLLEGYFRELDYYSELLKNRKINTIFFGGGTPSLMDVSFLSKLFKKINSIANIEKNCEISLEANPNSITFEKIRDFHKIGINRLSIGVQSLYDVDLKKLGRIHNSKDVQNSIKIAQKIFRDKYSIDLIYTRPNQSLENWEKELKQAIELSPFHLSLYQLIIEKGTPFYRNKIKLPNDDLSIDLYNTTREILENNNINFYEISNYAKKGYECKHNLVYWTNGEWLGIGAGAHSRINNGIKRYAIENTKNPIKWLNNCLKNGRSGKKYGLTNDEIIEEFVLMGLRIKDGIKLKDLQKNLNVKNLYEVLNEKNIHMLEKNNLLESKPNNIKIKNKGFILLNSIIEKIL